MTLDATTRAPRPPGSAYALSIGVRVVVLSGAAKGQSRLVGTRMTVGKAEDNQLVLEDPTVSRYHCEFERTKEGIVVRDLGSTNGTKVAGALIREAAVPVGTVIVVGEVEVALQSPNQKLAVMPSDRTRFGSVIGKSIGMRMLFGVLDFIAPSDASVLLSGETGTGKDVLARSIVAESRRDKGPFVVFDCGAVAYSLFESELFGHEKGAFTGAQTARQGAFERADGGTLFFDEVGELPLEVQPKLLRVLETKTFQRVGGNRVQRSDVRIIAATKRDLELDVSAGRFREDLFFRLAVVPLQVPPLRERREDIALIANELVTQLTPSGRTPAQLTEEAHAWLLEQEWPGNVRELRNVLDRAMHLSRGPTIDVGVLATTPTLGMGLDFFSRPVHEAQAAFLRAYARALEARYGEDREAAARHAGVSADDLDAFFRNNA